jgi:hypothetical protein
VLPEKYSRPDVVRLATCSTMLVAS